MEKGTVRSVGAFNISGVITDQLGLAVHFSNSDVVGTVKRLESGDSVWFERIGLQDNLKAVNIRKC